MSTAPIITQSEQPITGPQPAMAFTAGAIEPPDETDMLDWRTEPGSPALIWAVGCHGGAGVSTLAAQLAHVGDSGQRWPARPDEAPFVVLIARESARGLAAAEVAARQYHTGHAPSHIRLLGLVLVAAQPKPTALTGKKPAPSLRRHRELIVTLFDHIWRIDWHPYLIERSLADLPSAGPDEPVAKKFDPTVHVATDILALGRELRDHAREALQHNATP
jgi:hypothetical protein